MTCVWLEEYAQDVEAPDSVKRCYRENEIDPLAGHSLGGQVHHVIWDRIYLRKQFGLSEMYSSGDTSWKPGSGENALSRERIQLNYMHVFGVFSKLVK